MAEQTPDPGNPAGCQRGLTLLLLSAPDRAALLQQIDSLLAQPAEQPLLAAASNALAPAAQPAARLAIAAPQPELRARLEAARSRLAGLTRARLALRNSGIYLGLDAAPPTPRRIAFLFPGQGSQHVGMLHELYQHTPTVRAWLEALDAAYVQAGRPRPSALIYDGEQEPDGQPPAALFSMERGAQLSTAVGLALYDQITQLGIRADALVGHSIGEHAAVLAAHAGGSAFRATICAELCRLGQASVGMEEPPVPEAMAAVSAFDRAALDELVGRFPQRLFVAMDNCPHQQVLAGEAAAVTAAMQAIAAAGGICAPLPFVRAYHTPLFGNRAAKMAGWYRTIGLTPAPRRGCAPPVYSCLTGQPIPTLPAAAAQVMAQQWVAPVNFRTTVEQLYAAGIDTFVEVGPDAKLTAFVEDSLRGRPHLAVSMLGAATQAGAPRDLAQIGHMLAALYAHGVQVDGARYAALVAGDEIGWLGDYEIGDGLSPILSIPQSPNSSISQSPNLPIPQSHNLALSIHRTLRDAANTQMAAAAARLPVGRAAGQSRPARPGVAASGWPLLGDGVTVTATQLTTARRFTLQSDPFLADHSLGRSRAGHPGGGTLPVLSFTTSLALAAEAGQRLLAGSPNEQAALVLTDIRAQQWLALDDGALTVRVDAARQGSIAQVALREEGRGERQTSNVKRQASPDGAQLHNSQFTIHNSPFASERAAFQANVQLTSFPPPIPPALLHPDPSARPPARWTAARFYADYAFHGPSFQGLAQLISLGADSADAIVGVTSLPGLDARALRLDPALLDCAGQLVACWLLEQQGRAPTFGIFPVSARRFVQHRPTPPPGARLRCRCRVRLEAGGLTSADVVFFIDNNLGHELNDDRQVIATIEGFVQRLIEFPPALAACLFGGAAVDFSQSLRAAPGAVARQIDAQDWPILAEGQGIWQRLLAQQVLNGAERIAWQAVTAQDGELPLGWLLAMLTAKEATAAWAARDAGSVLSPAEISIEPRPGRHVAGAYTVRCPALAVSLHLDLAVAEQHIAAVVRQATQSG